MATHLRPHCATLVAAILASQLGCRSPTEAFVEITTDGPCEEVTASGITVGLLDTLEKKDFDTTSSRCVGEGDIGSIVLYPGEAENDDKFAFKVVTSLGAPVEGCVPPDYGPTCIVARRAMRFVPHTPFHVPVRMSQACAGILCPEDQTCIDGTCYSATLDPNECDKPEGCDPPTGVLPPWQKHFGGPGGQLARHIALGDNHVLAVTGSYTQGIDLGGGALNSKGAQDIFVATYTESGTHRWSKSFGAGGRDEGLSVAIDRHGAVYVLVSFEDEVDFGGGPLKSAGSTDVALVKLTTVGKLVWALRFGGAGGDVASKVTVGADDNVYVVGEFSGEAMVGDTKLTSAGGTDVMFASFTRAGKLRWAKSLGGPGDDGTTAVGVDAAGHVYVGGYFEDEVDFGGKKALAVVGTSDAFLASFEESGDFRWAKSFGANGRDLVLDLAARGDRVVVTGQLANEATIDGTVLAAKNFDGFVARFDTDGKIDWGTVFGGDGGDQGQSVAIAEDGSIVVGGSLFAGTAFGSKPVGTKGVSQPFVAVLEPSGKPRWAKAFSSSLYAVATGVAAPSDGFAYFAGWFTDTLAVGDKTLTADAEDMLLTRVAPP